MVWLENYTAWNNPATSVSERGGRPCACGRSHIDRRSSYSYLPRHIGVKRAEKNVISVKSGKY